MAPDPARRRQAPRGGSPGSVAAGVLLTGLSVVWLVLTSIVVADIVMADLTSAWTGDLLTAPEGDARRGLFLAGLVIAIELGTLSISVAVVMGRWWSRWVALAVVGAFGVFNASLLATSAPVLLVANLAALATVASLLTATLVSHRDDRVFLWGRRAPTAA